MSLPRDCRGQIEDAYRAMAEAGYRPAAPSDGLGNITVPEAALDVDAEARDYAQRWWAEEDDCTFTIGCANYEERVAMVFAIEAARLCCAGLDSRRCARRLLELAVEELTDGTASPATFTAFLLRQDQRDDHVGDLARDAREDPAWPAAGDFATFEDHLGDQGACAGAIDALYAAWREWERTR